MSVVDAKTKFRFNDIDYLTFETLTLVPIDKKLMQLSLLTQNEIEWIDNYHRTVYETLIPYMKLDYEIDYLKNATSPIGI